MAFSQSAFTKDYQLFLDRFAKSGAQAKVNELDERIAKGEAKISAALDRGVDVAAATDKLNGLRNEREQLVTEWISPRRAYSHVAALILAIEDMNLNDTALVDINIPNVLVTQVSVNCPPPF